MKMKTLTMGALAFATLMIGLISCKKNESNDSKPAVSKTDSLRVSFDRNGHYSLFSFKDGKVVPISDSASTKWDFGIRNINIIVNSHASGPGNAGVITVNGTYETFGQAFQTGYAYDTTLTQPAINASLNNGWYVYDPTTHAFTPKAGQFFVFTTTDNKYVKMEMLSAEYEPFSGRAPDWIIYKFRYTYQANGSTTF